ncbi:hypothetical protein SprV_0802500600 [Sparganum proliferum]
MQIEPHFGYDETVVRPAVGVTDSLGHQHFLPIWPPEENVFQQLRSGVQPSDLRPHWITEEDVGQQKSMSCAGSQVRDAIVVAVGDFMRTQHAPSRWRNLSRAGVEFAKDNQLVRLRRSRQEGVHVFVELGLRLIGASHWGALTRMVMGNLASRRRRYRLMIRSSTHWVRLRSRPTSTFRMEEATRASCRSTSGRALQKKGWPAPTSST